MAQSSCASLLCFSLLLSAIAFPRGDATFFTPPVSGVSVSGNLCCTQNGNCPGPAVTGAVATLSCASLFSGSVTLGQNTTDVNGFFNITVPITSGTLVGILPSKIPCLVSFQLPLSAAACPVLSTTNGVINGVLQTTGTVVTQVLGLVQAAQVSFYILLTI